jgi:sensor histidine kinase YesM
MTEQWREYWRRMLRHFVYLPIGIGVAFIPFLLGFREYQAQGQLARGVSIALSYGVIVSLSVFAHFAAVYAILFALGPKTMERWGMSLLFQVAVAALGTGVGIWLTMLARNVLAGEKVGGDFLPSLVFGLFCMVLFSLFLAYRQVREDALALRAAAAEARYDALERQMRPHFLFNSLNSLVELIETDAESAAEMAQTLADLYREILASSKTKTAPLRSELEIVRRYLDLERLRFGPRLAYDIRADEDLGEVHVPSLVLQTLVENAVKHGVTGSLDGGRVEVTAGREPGGLYRLAVANTGRPWSSDARDGTGLANTRERLDALFGDRHRFAVGADENGRTVASFVVTGERLG